jgi:hypothetical protein
MTFFSRILRINIKKLFFWNLQMKTISLLRCFINFIRHFFFHINYWYFQVIILIEGNREFSLFDLIFHIFLFNQLTIDTEP